VSWAKDAASSTITANASEVNRGSIRLIIALRVSGVESVGESNPMTDGARAKIAARVVLSGGQARRLPTAGRRPALRERRTETRCRRVSGFYRMTVGEMLVVS
jgi:hypothetical protein